jgi:hypothetical protein
MHDCPKCGKPSLNEREGIFHCLWCGFHRNVADSEHSYFGQSIGNFAMLTLLVVMIGAVLQPNYTPDQPDGLNIRGNEVSALKQPGEAIADPSIPS